MDEQTMARERADVSEQPTVASQANDRENGDLRRIVSLARSKDHLLTNRLLTALSEFIETVADTLPHDCYATRQTLSQASATLLSCVRGVDYSFDAMPAKETERQAYRGRLTPWQVRILTNHIDANLDASLSCEVLARLAKLSVSHFARAFN